MTEFLSIFTLVTTQWQRFVIYGVVIAAFLSVFGFWCYTKGEQKLFDYQVKQAQESVRIAKARTVVTHEVEVRWRDRDRVIVKQGETIIKEVPTYVTAQDDAACIIPAGFIRMWNDSNTGSVPQ